MIAIIALGGHVRQLGGVTPFLNNKQKKKIQVKECDRGRGGVREKNHHICLKYIQKSSFSSSVLGGILGPFGVIFPKKILLGGNPLKKEALWTI